ncbi:MULTISPECIES: helix-turn-helix domain-containing protein [Photorhabdus]|uniref:helix-turn-helix domain-containing protein n=1 Tax=Photorhabdus TaxID=29487 RepID=UPI001F0041E9|nr:helix-turn-helix domain-containing protein [Photorhabdus khanii]
MSVLETTIRKAGGVPALAKMLNVKDQDIRQWIKKGTFLLRDMRKSMSSLVSL